MNHWSSVLDPRSEEDRGLKYSASLGEIFRMFLEVGIGISSPAIEARVGPRLAWSIAKFGNGFSVWPIRSKLHPWQTCSLENEHINYQLQAAGEGFL
jgi:hypothetical protein